MSLLGDLQNMLTQNKSAGSQTGTSALAGLSGLLGPAALGGIAGALLTSSKGRKMAGNALLVGGGAVLAHTLWNKYKNRMQPPASTSPAAMQTTQMAQSFQPVTTGAALQANQTGQAGQADQANQAFSAYGNPPQAERFVRALVFAAKSDGHIDAKEAQAIRNSLSELNLGSDTEALIESAISEPLDPYILAKGVSNSEEALQLYLLSRSVIDVDHFMERAYLDALGKALGIPDEMMREIDLELGRQAMSQG